MLKITQKRCFLKRVKNDQKTSKKAKNGPNAKTMRGVSWYPKIVIFRQNYIREKPQKVGKSAKNRPFFGVPKPPKIDLFWTSFFDVDAIVTIFDVIMFHIKFFSSLPSFTHRKFHTKKSQLFAVFYFSQPK